jgi:hypothetical protein
MKTRGFLAIALVIFLAAVLNGAYFCNRPTTAQPTALDSRQRKATPAIPSTSLKQTAIAATLDAPIQKGKNTIWCVSYQASWKRLQNDIIKEPIKLQPAPQHSPAAAKLVAQLNQAYTPGPEIPSGCMYAAAGWTDDGIGNKIRRDLAKQFPGLTLPNLDDESPHSIISYAYLEANVPFHIPYSQKKLPLEFTDSSGKKIPVRAFGLKSSVDVGGHPNPDKQPKILFAKQEYFRDPKHDHFVMGEFAIDLDAASQPNQIILAVVKPQKTLAATVQKVTEKIAVATRAKQTAALEPNDSFWYPEMSWKIEHHFIDLEYSQLLNQLFKFPSNFSTAQQFILFKLDGKGAELKSGGLTNLTQGIPNDYSINRPFLIIMQKRGAPRPYFVMWVDNAELLRKM